MLWGVSKVLAAREGVNEAVGQVLECWGEQTESCRRSKLGRLESKSASFQNIHTCIADNVNVNAIYYVTPDWPK